MAQHPEGHAEVTVDARTGDPWKLTHHPWTPEGQIEGAGAFARGANAATGWRRPAAKVVILVVLGAVLVAVLSVLAPLLSGG